MTRPHRVTALALGSTGPAIVAGVLVSSFGLAVPWLIAAVLAVAGLVWPGGRRFLLAAAAGVAIGAIVYLGLGWMSAAFDWGSPANSSGGS